MSLTPAFEIGLWNAWILAVLLLPIDLLVFLIDRNATRRFHVRPSYSRTEKISNSIANYVIVMATIVYSIFLRLLRLDVWSPLAGFYQAVCRS